MGARGKMVLLVVARRAWGEKHRKLPALHVVQLAVARHLYID